MTFSEIQMYFGNEYEKKYEQVKRELEQLFNEKKDIQYCFLKVPKDKMLLIFLYTTLDLHAIKRWLQNYRDGTRY